MIRQDLPAPGFLVAHLRSHANMASGWCDLVYSTRLRQLSLEQRILQPRRFPELIKNIVTHAHRHHYSTGLRPPRHRALTSHQHSFLYPPELPLPRGLYSAHKINPNIKKNIPKKLPGRPTPSFEKPRVHTTHLNKIMPKMCFFASQKTKKIETWRPAGRL